MHFLNENVRISIKISLNLVLKVPIKNIPALVQAMAWRRLGAKPLSEPMLAISVMHICITRPQWINSLALGMCACKFNFRCTLMIYCICFSDIFNLKHIIKVYNYAVRLRTGGWYLMWNWRHFNSLWPSDIIKQHRSGSTLAQVMAQYLICWHQVITGTNVIDFSLERFCGIHLRPVSRQVPKLVFCIYVMSLNITLNKIAVTYPGSQGVWIIFSASVQSSKPKMFFSIIH